MNMPYYPTHGLNGKAYEQKKAELLQEQKGKCAMCQRPFNVIDKFGKVHRKPFLDHNHKTGKIRGLLCDRCNSHRIGWGNKETYLYNMAYRSIEIHIAAYEAREYLEKYGD